MDKITKVRRLIKVSLKLIEYKDMLIQHSNLERSLLKNGLSRHSMDLIKQDIEKKMLICRVYIKNRILELIYNGSAPLNLKDRKIFGETVILDDMVFINPDSIYYSVDYISRYDLKNGYILFTELIEKSLGEVNTKIHMLNLHTGEFSESPLPEKLISQPVDLSIYRNQTIRL